MLIVGICKHIFLHVGQDPVLGRIVAVHIAVKLGRAHGFRFRLCSKFSFKGCHILRIIIGKALCCGIVNNGLHLCQLAYRHLIKIILPGHIVGILLLGKILWGIQSHIGQIGAIHGKIAVYRIVIVVIIFYLSDFIIANFHIGVVDRCIFRICGHSYGYYNRRSDCRDYNNASYFKTLQRFEFFFLLNPSLFHFSVIFCHDLFAFFFRLLIIRHGKLPSFYLCQVLYLINVKQAWTFAWIFLHYVKFCTSEHLFRTNNCRYSRKTLSGQHYSQYNTLSFRLQQKLLILRGNFVIGGWVCPDVWKRSGQRGTGEADVPGRARSHSVKNAA